MQIWPKYEKQNQTPTFDGVQNHAFEIRTFESSHGDRPHRAHLLALSMSQTPHPHAHHDHDPHTPWPQSHQPPDGTDADDYETANKHHFDATAHQYNDRRDAQKRAEKIGQAMRDTGLFKQGITTVMDFACGTGEPVVLAENHIQRQSSHHLHRLFYRPHLPRIGGRGPQINCRRRYQPRNGRSI